MLAIKQGKKKASESASLARWESLKVTMQVPGKRLVLPAVDGMAASVTHFVALEVGDVVDTIVRFGSFSAGRSGAAVAVLRVVVVIYMSAEAFGAMEPRAHTDERSAGKPLRAIVAVGRAFIRRSVVVTVGTFRGDSNLDAHLSLGFGNGYSEADSSNRS
jgi:hypothetical protein